MGCKILGEEKRIRDREEKSLVWFENFYVLRKKVVSIIRWCFLSF